MSRIVPVLSPPQNVAAIFQEIEGAFGRVPNLFKTYAHHPPLLQANWNKVKAQLLLLRGRPHGCPARHRGNGR
jgi:hypothetical protein